MGLQLSRDTNRADAGVIPAARPPGATAGIDVADPHLGVCFQSVSFRYPDQSERSCALVDVSFSFPSGSVVALLGRNGCGKSTLIKVARGLYPVGAGSATVLGRSPFGCSQTRRLVSYLPASDSLLSGLSVTENLAYRAALRGVSRSDIESSCSQLIDRFGLESIAKASAGALSTGQCRRVSFASACLGDPRIVLLDEPTTGVDIVALPAIHSQIREWRNLGATVFIATHSLDDAFSLCDHVLVLDQGRLRISDRTALIAPDFTTFKQRVSTFLTSDESHEHLRTSI